MDKYPRESNPPKPENRELTAEELEAVVGGANPHPFVGAGTTTARLAGAD
jgi:hypothetical protein